jgi:tetratricopeptide (TPR) repeat protein
MTVFKRSSSRLRKQTKVIHKVVRRVLHMLVRYPGFSAIVAYAPRTPKRNARNSVKFEVGGSITRSIIFAIPSMHIEGFDLRTIGSILVVVIVIVTVITTTTSPKNPLPQFESGKPHIMDVVIAPLQVASNAGQTCTKFAWDYNERLAGVLANDKTQGTEIWSPQQVNVTLPKGEQNDLYIQRYAIEHQADLVLYGSISCSGQSAIINPKIYANATFYAGAPEIKDFYSCDDMVNQLSVKMENGAIEQAASDQAARAATFIKVGRGFNLYESASISDLKQASDLFMQLAQASNMNDRHGLAMLWYMAGKSQLKSVPDECNQPDISRLKQAEISFQAALQHEPQFALAYAYLGTISLNEALVIKGDQAKELAEIRALLNKSLAHLEHAHNALIHPDNGLANVIAEIGEAQAKITLHDLNPANIESNLLLQEAVTILNQVIKENTASIDESKEMNVLIAHAYAILGDVQRAMMNDDLALSSYTKALMWGEGSRLKPVIDISLAELYTDRGDACTAKRFYQDATQTQCPADKRVFTLQAQQMQFFCQRFNDSQLK